MFDASRGAYGCRLVPAAVNRQDVACSVGLVADVMRELGLHACLPKAYKRTTVSAELRAERERLRREERELTERTERLARHLRRDWSVRDTAHLLGVSMQRVSQIAPEKRPERPPGRRKAA